MGGRKITSLYPLLGVGLKQDDGEELTYEMMKKMLEKGRGGSQEGGEGEGVTRGWGRERAGIVVVCECAVVDKCV